MEHATDATFDRLTGRLGLTVVAFHSGFRGAFARNRPALERVLAARGIRLVAVNLDRCPEIRDRLGLVAYPEYRLHRDGVPVATRAGSFSFSGERGEEGRKWDLAFGRADIARWLDGAMGREAG